MRFQSLLAVVLLLSVGLPVSAVAKSKPTGPTPSLKELISDPQYLKQSLGTKALVMPDFGTGKITAVVSQAIHDARLDETIEFHPLPKEAKPPIPRIRQSPLYPPDLRQKRIEGEARFLMVIGADGKVKGLYCHQSTDPAFATSAAAAISKWLFLPSKLGKTPVPVLTGVAMKFTLADITPVFE